MRKALSLLPLLVFTACESDTVNLKDSTPEEASEQISDVYCGFIEECGIPNVDCADFDPNGGARNCTVDFFKINYDVCISQFKPQVAAALECKPLTDNEADIFSKCLTELKNFECLTEAQVQELLNGNPSGLGDLGIPTSCESVELDIGNSCDDTGPTIKPIDSCSGSGSGSVSGCNYSWGCNSGSYAISCTAVEGSGYTCNCVENGVDVDQFTSPSICENLSDADATARTGCGWDL